MTSNRKYNNHVLDTDLDEFNNSMINIVNDDNEIFTQLIYNEDRYYVR